MFTIIFDKKSKYPLYEQLYLQIRGLIESGQLQKGEKLPSKRKLATHLQISTITVENSYNQLIDEGYVYSLPKKGFYVQDNLLSFSKGFSQNKLSNLTNVDTFEKIVNKNIEYDFKTNAVDTKLFPFQTWAKNLRKVLSENSENLLNKTNPKGLLELRKEIARHLFDYRGIEVCAEQIIVGAGSEYIYSLLIQILGTDLSYGVENPGYKKIREIFKANKLDVLSLPLDEYGLKSESIYLSKADVIHITPSHQFPTGVIMPVTRRQELLSWAQEKEGRYIIEDDYDSEFKFSGSIIPAMQRLDKNEKVIYINSFSKSLAPSIRISYMVLPSHLIEVFESNFSYYSSSVSNFDQYTLQKFMKNGHFEHHLFRMRKIYKQRRDVLIDCLNSSKLCKYIKILGQDAGLHIILEVTTKTTEQKLLQSALDNNVKLYGIHEYADDSLTYDKPSIIMGFSGIDGKSIAIAINILEKTWLNTI